MFVNREALQMVAYLLDSYNIMCIVHKKERLTLRFTISAAIDKFLLVWYTIARAETKVDNLYKEVF